MKIIIDKGHTLDKQSSFWSLDIEDDVNIGSIEINWDRDAYEGGMDGPYLMGLTEFTEKLPEIFKKVYEAGKKNEPFEILDSGLQFILNP